MHTEFAEKLDNIKESNWIKKPIWLYDRTTLVAFLSASRTYELTVTDITQTDSAFSYEVTVARDNSDDEFEVHQQAKTERTTMHLVRSLLVKYALDDDF